MKIHENDLYKSLFIPSIDSSLWSTKGNANMIIHFVHMKDISTMLDKTNNNIFDMGLPRA